MPIRQIAIILLLSFSSGLVISEEKNPDPWERFNRKSHAFNEFFDKYLLKPVAKGYKKVTPEPVDKGITNFFSNLG